MKTSLFLLLMHFTASLFAQTDTVYQKLTLYDKTSGSDGTVILRIIDMKDYPLRNFPVRLVCKKTDKIYITETNSNGEARFHVPAGQKYEVGIEEFENYTDIDMPDKPGVVFGKGFGYQPTRIVETNRNDTITQDLLKRKGPTSARAYMKITIVDFDRKALGDEEIFLKEMDGSRVYYAKTASNGMAEFLLPLGYKYILHMKYESDIDMIDLLDRKVTHDLDIGYTYIGSKKIEAYYVSTHRDKNGFLTEFMESKISPKAFDGKVKTTDNGFLIEFPSGSSTSAPAMQNDMLFTDGGYFTHDYYCFDPKTGTYRWGVELADGGPSATIYEDGVVLINTQSCTLYAIDANTGTLLWSKWLGPNIYSTPSVSNNKVFVVYPNNNQSKDYDKKNVMVCFDLRTGKINWQSWMEAEVLASPVISSSYVYCSSLTGHLYQFEEASGNLVTMIDVNAVTPPMIVDGKVYVSIKNAEGSQQVAAYSAENLGLLQQFNTLKAPLHFQNLMDLSSAEKMSFEGSRMMHYKGSNYNVMGNRLICSDPGNGSIIWSMMISAEDASKEKFMASMPIVVDDKILISTADGEIRAYHPSSGKLLNKYYIGEPLMTQAIISDGWIYSCSSSGKVISINTKNPSLTGWPMWSFNGSHNTVVE